MRVKRFTEKIEYDARIVKVGTVQIKKQFF